jgi:hypothetical protein
MAIQNQVANQALTTTSSPEFAKPTVNNYRNAFDSIQATEAFPTIALDLTSKQLQIISADDESSGCVIELPNATTLNNGDSYWFISNEVTGGVVLFGTYQSGTIFNVSFPYDPNTGAASDFIKFTLADNSTADGVWTIEYIPTAVQTWPLQPVNGGTGISTYTPGALLYAATSTGIAMVGSVPGSGTFGGAVGWSNANGGPTFSTASLARSPWMSGSVAGNGPGFASWQFSVPSTNGIMYWSSLNLQSNISPVNSAVLVSNGSGVPSMSTTLPTGLAMQTPASITLTNGTGLPIAGTTGYGTGVATALAVNTNSTGGFAVETDGTFTPVLAFGGASVGVTYSTQRGDYTRVGNTVTFEIQITLTSKGSSTGAATITGLPVNVRSSSLPVYYVVLQGTTYTGVPVGYQMSSVITLSSQATTGSLTGLTNTNFSGTDVIYITGTYLG